MAVKIDDFNCGVTGETILQALDKALIFRVEKMDDGRFEIQESCDNYFHVALTKEQVLALTDELRALCGARTTPDDLAPIVWCACGDQIMPNDGALCGTCASTVSVPHDDNRRGTRGY